MMKLVILLAISACLLTSVTDALILEKRDIPTVVSFPLRRATRTPESHLRRRNWQLLSPLSNQEQMWYVELLIGSTQQTISVALDTGSSDLVVETDSSDLCQSNPVLCNRHGTYNANSSFSYNYLNSNLNIEYGGHDTATGDYCTDNLIIAGATIRDLEFGIMYETTVSEGVLGLGYATNEALRPNYANLLVQLVAQGFIEAKSYSVWLNNNRSPGGTILFGGVDSNKYSGSLVTLPFVPAPGENMIKEFFVTLQEVRMSNGPGTSTISLTARPSFVPALLDTGTTYIFLPDEIVKGICSVLGLDFTQGKPTVVDCSLGGSTFRVEFMFQGNIISVGLDQLVLPHSDSADKCTLGIVSSESVILGAAFLSSTYVVFDLDNNEASIAPAKFDVSSEANVLQIRKGH